MIGALGTCFVLIAATVLQQLLPQVTVLAGSKVPVLLTLVLYYALTRSRWRMLAIALGAGVLVDSLSLMPLGYSAVCFCAIGLLTSLFRSLVFEDTLITQLCFGAVASFIGTIAIMLAIADRIALADCSWWWLAIRVLGTTALGAGITPLVFALARSMDHVVQELKWGNAT